MTNSIPSHNYQMPSAPQRSSSSTTINTDQTSTPHPTNIFDTSLSPGENALKAFKATSDSEPMANSKQINELMDKINGLMLSGNASMPQIAEMMNTVKKLVQDSSASTASTTSTAATNSLMFTC